MKHFLAAILVSLALGLSACAGSTSYEMLDATEALGDGHSLAESYQLGSGDEVRVTIFGEPELSGRFRVDGQGKLSMPLVGDIPAGQKTLHETEAALVAKLSEGYLIDPRVAVEVLNYRPFYILGEVKAPGSYPYVDGMTVFNAVALGGGFTYRADKDEITIVRGATVEPKLVPNLATLVHPGDVLEVRERFF